MENLVELLLGNADTFVLNLDLQPELVVIPIELSLGGADPCRDIDLGPRPFIELDGIGDDVDEDLLQSQLVNQELSLAITGVLGAQSDLLLLG